MMDSAPLSKTLASGHQAPLGLLLVNQIVSGWTMCVCHALSLVNSNWSGCRNSDERNLAEVVGSHRA